MLPCYKQKVLAWFILFFAALSVVFLGGKRRAFGTFIATLHVQFNETSLVMLDWIGVSYSGFALMTSSLSVMMILHFKRRYGLFQFIGSLFVLASCISSAYAPTPPYLFLTHSLLHGIGSSLLITIAGLVVNEHFDKRHPYHILATTLISGGSLASILFITFFAYLIEMFNWRNAFLILGGVYFVVMAAGSIFFRKNSELLEVVDSKRFSCNSNQITSYQIPLLVLWFLERILTSVVTYGILMNIVDYVHRYDSNIIHSTYLADLYAGGEGATYLVGAIITGSTKNFFKNKLKHVLIVTSLINGGALIAFEFLSHNLIASYVLMFISGFAMGPSNTFLFPAGEELTQLPGHIAYPFSLFGMGFGMLISPLLSGLLAQIYKYKWFFIIQGVLVLAKAVFLIVMAVILWCYKKRGMVLSYPTLLPSDPFVNAREGTIQNKSLIIPQESIRDF